MAGGQLFKDASVSRLGRAFQVYRKCTEEAGAQNVINMRLLDIEANAFLGENALSQQSCLSLWMCSLMSHWLYVSVVFAFLVCQNYVIILSGNPYYLTPKRVITPSAGVLVEAGHLSWVVTLEATVFIGPAGLLGIQALHFEHGECVSPADKCSVAGARCISDTQTSDLCGQCNSFHSSTWTKCRCPDQPHKFQNPMPFCRIRRESV